MNAWAMLTMPTINTANGYASTGGLMGLRMKRCSVDGALAACWKSLAVGLMLCFGVLSYG